jgi:hypothetical protein
MNDVADTADGSDSSAGMWRNDDSPAPRIADLRAGVFWLVLFAVIVVAVTIGVFLGLWIYAQVVADQVRSALGS